MDPVSAGLAAVSIGSSIVGGLSANKKAEEAAEDQAKLMYSKRSEEIRQKRKLARRERGTARAMIGASNIQFSGSADQYINALDYENMREVALAREQRKREQEAILAGARGAGDSLFYQAAGDAIGYAAREVIGSNLFAGPSDTYTTTQPGGSPSTVPISLEPLEYR